MRKRIYRCYACDGDDGRPGRDFDAVFEDSTLRVKLHDGLLGEAATCPKCGTSNTDSQLGGNVVPVELIHYEPPATKAMHGRKGRGTIACDPAVKVVASRPKGQELRFSGEPLAVNCPLCKATKEFVEMSGGQLHPSFDIPLGDKLEVPELHKYEKPADPTKPPRVAPQDL